MELGWKRAERMLAQGVGTSRIPVTGERAGADCEAGMFSYQIKSRTGQPVSLGVGRVQRVHAMAEERLTFTVCETAESAKAETIWDVATVLSHVAELT